MSHTLQRHPRSAELREQLRAHPEWFNSWSGVLFRFQTVDFPTPKDILNGRGAGWRGGRWNAPDLATVYGSTTDSTALEECKANDRYYGVETRSPRLLIAIEARLTRVLDLTSPDIRRALGITLTELAAEDWRKLLAVGSRASGRECGCLSRHLQKRPHGSGGRREAAKVQHKNEKLTPAIVQAIMQAQ